MLVAVLAFGTVGDVRPLLALSIELCGLNEECQLTFVTNQAHQEWASLPSCDGRLKPFWISTLPARRWNDLQSGKRKVNDGSWGSPEYSSLGRDGVHWQDEEQHRRACIAACELALQLRFQSDEGKGTSVIPDTPSDCSAPSIIASEGAGLGGNTTSAAFRQRLIIFNLFALEGFHIAEGLGVPCIAASPCLVPYPPPASFQRRFQREEPRLYLRLQAAAERSRAVDGAAGQGSGSDPDDDDCDGEGCVGEMSWQEVSHWMWPLFTERWGAWRYHCLGLPPLPYSATDPDCPLPPPPLLLYGVSPYMVPHPGYWPPPRSVCLTGAWHSALTFPPAQLRLPAQLAALLGAHQRDDAFPGQRGQQQQQQQQEEEEEDEEQQQEEKGEGQGQASAPQGKVSGPIAHSAAERAQGLGATWQLSRPSRCSPSPPAPVCCDFGSMGALGLIPSPAGLLHVLNSAAQQAQRPFILLAGGWPALVDAWDRLQGQGGQSATYPEQQAGAASGEILPQSTGSAGMSCGRNGTGRAGSAEERELNRTPKAAIGPAGDAGELPTAADGMEAAGTGALAQDSRERWSDQTTRSVARSWGPGGTPLPPPFPAHQPLPWLMAVRAPLSHDVILPACAALLHHGGAGTVAAALRCGVPQIVCPLHFDQHYWAERISWNSLGVSIPADALFPPAGPSVCDSEGGGGHEQQGRAGAIISALQHVLSTQAGIRESCRAAQAAAAGEQGTKVAVRHIQRYLARYNRWRRDCRRRMPAGGPACEAEAGEGVVRREGVGGAARRGKRGEGDWCMGGDPHAGRVFQDQDTCMAAGQKLQGRTAGASPPAVDCTLPNGLTVRCLAPAETLHIYREIWEERCYLQEGIAVPTGGTVLDVGANIGLFTLHLLLDTHHHSQRQQEQQRRHTQGAEQAQQPRQLASAGLHGPTGKGPLPGGPPSLTQSGPLTSGGQVSNTSEGGGHGREDCSFTAALSSGRGPVQVWAFEPVPDIWGVLVHNLRAHGLEGRVHVVQSALHARPGPLELTFYPSMPGNSTCKPGEKWRYQREYMAGASREAAFGGARDVYCQATTLARFVAEQGLDRIDLVKVDVEGCELEVLLGMDPFCWSITKQIVLEVHDVEGRVGSVESLLKQQGFRVTRRQQQDVKCNTLLYGTKDS